MVNILNASEIVLLKKLCQPNPFAPTVEERAIMESFLKRKIVKKHRDGSLEITEYGADCYVDTLDSN